MAKKRKKYKKKGHGAGRDSKGRFKKGHCTPRSFVAKAKRTRRRKKSSHRAKRR